MAEYSLLILEDDPAHIEAIRHAFESAEPPAEIRVASTVRDYCDLVADRPPDIALIDLNLPDTNPQEALCLLSETTPFPVVVMTSMGSEEIAVAAMKLGAADYLIKSPETFADMPRFLHRALLSRKTTSVSAGRVIKEAFSAYRDLADSKPPSTSDS